MRALYQGGRDAGTTRPKILRIGDGRESWLVIASIGYPGCALVDGTSWGNLFGADLDRDETSA